jgi:hypothetical protein
VSHQFPRIKDLAMASVVVGFPTEAMEFFQWKMDQHEEGLLVMAQNRSKHFCHYKFHDYDSGSK